MNPLPLCVAIVATASSLACAGGGEAQPLRIGATFTLEQSGALARLDTAGSGMPGAVIVLGSSAQILRSALAGDLDVTVTHAPHLEARLRDSGRVALWCPLFTSRFVIVGPRADPARAGQAATAAAAFRRIADARAPFVSRGDSSGTHLKELEIWAAAGTALPTAPQYLESGTDQAGALRVAAERDAYALVDLPTWTPVSPEGMRVLFTGDTTLNNPYALHLMRHAAGTGETAFARQAIDEWRPRVVDLGFTPSDGACAEPAP